MQQANIIFFIFKRIVFSAMFGKTIFLFITKLSKQA
jgi:hypothetical protein